MDAGDLRDELGFFGRGRDIENGFGHGNLFRILSRGDDSAADARRPASRRTLYSCYFAALMQQHTAK